MQKKYILKQVIDKEYCYLTAFESDFDSDKGTILFYPEISQNISEASVYTSLEEAEHVNTLLENKFTLEPYKMKPVEIVLRTISFIFAYVVIVPLYLVTLICSIPLNLANNFTYDRFTNYILPDEAIRVSGTGTHSIGFLKIWLLFIMPFISPFFDTYYAAKNLKF